MAFTPTAIVECRTGGSDTNCSGIFDPGVSGFPTDGAATLGTSNAPLFSSASYTFVAGDVGAYIYVKSGTNWIAGWYPITAVTASPNSATLDASIGAVVTADLSGLSTVAGCATTASPTGATWGVDYSRQNGSQITFTDMVIGTPNTTFTSVLKPVGKNYIGNSINVTSGTGFTVQRVVIASTVTTVATCDKALGTIASSGGNGRLGGGLLSPSIATSLLGIAGMCCFVQNGTYVISSNTTNTAGGAMTAGSANTMVIGYSGANRYFGNTGTAPLIQNSGSTITPIQVAGNFYNFAFDGNAQTAARLTSALCYLVNCSISNFNTIPGTSLMAVGCLFTGNSVTCTLLVGAYNEAYANTATPIAGANFKSLSYANTGATTDGFTITTSQVAIECHAIGNGRSGFRFSGATAWVFNCHAQGNGVSSGTGYGYQSAGAGQFKAINCTGQGNQTGLVDTTNAGNGGYVFQFGITAVSGDVYVSVAGNNYALNNLAGAGAALRAAGRMAVLQTYPRGLTTSYFDIGGVQHQDITAVIAQTINVFEGGQ